MADENETLKKIQLEANKWLAEKNKDGISFIQILADKSESFDLATLQGCLALKVKYDAWKKEQEQSSNGSFLVRDGNKTSQPAPQNQNTGWIQEKIKHWDSEWCQKPDKDYKFDPIETDIRLKFDIYKTEADKAAGKKAVTVEYNNERDVSLSTEDGKAPDFEFFNKMIQEAKENDQVPGVTFEGEMSPDFKAKLAIACIKHGLPMTGFDGRIDLNLLSPEELNSLGEDVTKKVGYHNKYVTAKEAAQAHLANAETKDKPFDLSTVEDMNDAAIVFAAYKNAGVTVDGVSTVFKNSPEGLIHTTDFKFMPQEAQETIGKHNKEIRNQMLTRTQGKARVPGPVVAEDKDEERKLAQHVINDETPKVLKSAESHATATKNFKNFILGGLEDR